MEREPETVRTSTQLADALAAGGVASWPHYFSVALCAELSLNIEALSASKDLHDAAIGRSDHRGLHLSIRSDRIHWLESPGATTAQRIALAQLETLRQAMNEELYLGIKELECHFASYAAGGHYDKHLDRFRDDNSRVISIVIYLDADWTEADSGELRLYDQNDKAIVTADVLPAQGKLVCFLSDKIWHEVLPTKRQRRSLTGWFRT